MFVKICPASALIIVVRLKEKFAPLESNYVGALKR